MAELNFYETGKLAPANVTRNFGAIYIWVTPKGAVNYIQKDFPRGRNWQLLDLVGGVKYLNDLLDVQTSPTPGQVLTYNGTFWDSQTINADTPLGNSLFVSSKGKTVAAGAVRESITNHFSSLDEAIAAAVSGDTIHIYSDQVCTVGMAKLGVQYEIYNQAFISGIGTHLISDGGGAVPYISIRGNGRLRQLSIGQQVVYLTGVDTTLYEIECYDISGLGGAVVRIEGGVDESYIKCSSPAENAIDNTLSNWTVRLQGSPRGTIYANIDGHQISGGIQIPLYYGAGVATDFKVVGSVRTHASSPQSTVNTISGGAGTLTIVGNVYSHVSATKVFFWGEGTIHSAGKVVINGDIYSDTRPAYYRYNNSATIYHNGNLYSSYTSSLARCNGESGTFDLQINGDIICTGALAPMVIKQTAGTFRHNGKVHNQFIPAGAGGVGAANVTAGGTGYPTQTYVNNVSTTGGSGAGLTVDICNTNNDGDIDFIEINNPGAGYVVGDVVTISGAGAGDATITITHVGANGIVLRDAAGYDAVFDNTLIVIDATLGDETGLAGYTTNKDVVVTNQVASNKTAALVTNLVTGSSIFDDPQIQ